jgi:hypothetical protein
MATPTARHAKVFVSYSHHDKVWLERLQIHLKPLERRGLIDRWDDTKLISGSRWRKEIENAIATAKVAVLLISADYLASEFIAKDELRPLLDSAEKKGMVILPVIVSPCLFTETPLAQFQAVNRPDEPLIGLDFSKQEEIFVSVAKAIEDALSQPPSTRKNWLKKILIAIGTVVVLAAFYIGIRYFSPGSIPGIELRPTPT